MLPRPKNRFSVLAQLVAWVSFVSCAGGDGSSREPGGFDLLSTSVVPDSTVPINSAIEFTFEKAIDPKSIHFGSISIQGLPPSAVGAPAPGPVSGGFFRKPGLEHVVVFQPACPTDTALSNGGLLAGNLFGAVSYQVTVGGLNGPANSVVAALDGSKLRRSYSFSFRTPAPPTLPLFDPIPEGAPRVIGRENLPAQLPLNLWSEPMTPLLLELDQPVLVGSVDNDTVRIEFDHPSLGLARVPTAVSLGANCTQENRAQLFVTPIGVLPPETELRFVLSKRIEGFGADDKPATDEIFHIARVVSAASPEQRDAILELFLDEASRDPDPAWLDPPASWGEGHLGAGPLFPGGVNDLDIEVGPGSTNSNGGSFVFSTDSGQLKDTNGFSHNFPGGIVEVRNFRVKSPIGGGSSVFFAVGTNPLVIRASESIAVEAGAFIVVDGQDANDVIGIGVPNLPHPGAAGICGGGDGGTSSPNTTNSDARGGDGQGPFGILAGGGQGGESAYGSLGANNDVGGGGGGGNFGLMEADTQGNWVANCYSSTTCSPVGCPMPLPTGGGCTNPNCNGVNTNPATHGEPGGSGAQCGNQINPAFVACDLGGSNGKICQYGAITGTCLARGGVPGQRVFVDSDSSNDFVGRKPEFQSGRIAIQRGELPGPLPGQGGGAGGDTVTSQVFPSGVNNFVNTDLKAGAGGGGAGVLILQALARIEIRGTLRCNGGNGGAGEQQSGGFCGTAAGGGGSAGTIALECPGQTIFGKNARLLAQGGNRGRGCGAVPGQPTNAGGSYCRSNGTAGRGGAGGKGPIHLALPFDPDPAQAISCGTVTRPAVRAGALFVEDANSVLQPVSCERAASLAPIADPDLHLILPTFGPRSAAMSRWIPLGWSDMSGAPQWEFAGTDAQGKLDTGYSQILASGSATIAQQPSADRVDIDSSSLADRIRTAPRELVGDGFQSAPGSSVLFIADAFVSGNRVSLILDLSTGAVGTLGNWTILRRYAIPEVQGALSNFPSGVEAKILFEAADETGPGTGVPDPATLAGPTGVIGSLAGKKLLRFRIEFDRNPGNSPLQPNLPEIGLRLLKVPYSF